LCWVSQSLAIATSRDANIRDIGQVRWNGNTHATVNSLHPTQKPVCIFTPLIECFSLPGDVVLDPFCGSGSTLVAAQQLGRQFVRTELSKRYFNAPLGFGR
jgi:DNA modification methylase